MTRMRRLRFSPYQGLKRTNVKSLFTKLVAKLKAAFALPEATPALAFA